MSKKCQNCSTEMADNMNFCPSCKAKYVESIIKNNQGTDFYAKENRKNKIGKIVGGAVGIIIFILVSLYSCFGSTLNYHAGLDAIEKGKWDEGYIAINQASKDGDSDAKEWLNNLFSENGDSNVQYEIGWLLYYGKGRLAKNEKVGLTLLKLAANQGHEDAKTEVYLNN